MATKDDIRELKQETKADMEKLAQSTKAGMEKLDDKIDKLAQSTKADNKELRQEIKELREGINSGVRWTIDIIMSAIIGVGGLVVAILKYWH